MTLHARPRVLHYYEELEHSLPLRFSENGLAESVHFGKNRYQPIHNWFHFKEGFASQLLNQIGIDLRPLSRPHSVFVDPFCGSGTTILAGDLQHRWQGLRVGIEVNPFLRFVADTKARWREFDPMVVRKQAEAVVERKLQKDRPSNEWPDLSTLSNREMFEPERVSALLDAVERVSALACAEKDLLLLGIASAAEKLGYYRKDGRALRILRTEAELASRRSLVVEDLLLAIWRAYADHIALFAGTKGKSLGNAQVVQGNGIALAPLAELGVQRGAVSLFTYSPPYLNHIDYTEVYKVELWLLGFVVSQAEMLALRKQTLRSHASYSFLVEPDGLPDGVVEVVNLLANEIEATGKSWHRQFRRTALGYFHDMKLAFLNQFEYLQAGGRSICVVANSAHGSGSHRVTVATDLLLAQLAQSVGFEIERVLVARRTQRRDSPNPYLRESVIILKKR